MKDQKYAYDSRFTNKDINGATSHIITKDKTIHVDYIPFYIKDHLKSGEYVVCTRIGVILNPMSDGDKYVKCTIIPTRRWLKVMDGHGPDAKHVAMKVVPQEGVLSISAELINEDGVKTHDEVFVSGDYLHVENRTFVIVVKYCNTTKIYDFEEFKLEIDALVHEDGWRINL